MLRCTAGRGRSTKHIIHVALPLFFLLELAALIPQYQSGNIRLLAQSAGIAWTSNPSLPSTTQPKSETLVVGAKGGPWTIQDSLGEERKIPCPGKVTVVIAQGVCHSCNQKSLLPWVKFAQQYPKVAWFCLVPDAQAWEKSQAARTREAFVFLNSPALTVHRMLGADFTPKAYVFGIDGKALYIQPPEISEEAAMAAVEAMVRGNQTQRKQAMG